MKAFFDHNIAPHLARSVNEVIGPLGHEAVAKIDRFAGNTADSEWIETLGHERGWVVFTADKNILHNPVERRALYASGMTAFFFKPAVRKLNTRQRTATVLWHWDALVDFVARQSRGTYWLPLNKNSRFEQVRD